MANFTEHVKAPRERDRYPVDLMVEPGDYFDVIGANPKSVSVQISSIYQGVGGAVIRVHALPDRVRVMLIDIGSSSNAAR